MKIGNFFGRGLAASYRAGAEHIRKLNAANRQGAGANKFPARSSSAGQPIPVTRHESGETRSQSGTKSRGQLPTPEKLLATD